MNRSANVLPLSVVTATSNVKSVAKGRQKSHWHDRIGHLLLLFVCIGLAVFLLMPVMMILIQSVQDKNGAFVGLRQFSEYMSTPALRQSVLNTLTVSISVTALVIPAAFTFAYALTRSMMPLKRTFRTLSLIPILAPSLLAAISFVQWFGTQGVLKGLLGGHSIYGPIGIIISECYAVFPHALMILITALTLADGRLYEVAESLGTSRLRKFRTITLPGAKYGLISAMLVVFTFTVNDFGVPKVIGGDYSVLAMDVYQLVIGQQDFNKGAVVSLLLLLPALLAFAIDYTIRRKLQSQLSARAVPFVPKRHRMFDSLMFCYCSIICALLLAVLSMAVYTSFIKLWPYNRTLVWDHYYFGLFQDGILESYFNSLRLAAYVVASGIVLIFGSAYLVEKTRGMNGARPIIRLLAMLPMGVPGLVLGLGYIMFFNHPDNPLNVLYRSMTILVLSTVVHYFTSSYLTAVTALKAIDNEFEAVSASLKVPFYKTFFRVTVPVCLPAVLDIGRYLFINAMTTISAVVFLYSPDTTLASVAILNLEAEGKIGPAAAMGTLIVLTSSIVVLLYALTTRVLLKKAQRWRKTV
ncbi:iron(III) transport system permease protein [Collimonas sp. OK607]|uniref:putative 2-aminoethylphosphonate ABC transporter permease subunit n=1 Tax=Collimonas sp. OK607 TaxID=1798194 RepID=UPI0008E2622C|nr:putative 2-aminoethylphosphonate ABC transporter permease subunit [Collimonas sp. OK607]SFB38910.1 iron(III) transport system permease protein [Collimonas sp. OK607]